LRYTPNHFSTQNFNWIRIWFGQYEHRLWGWLPFQRDLE